MTLRIRFEYESNPDFSDLEQWNTPEKYYGGAPKCPTCDCEMDYEKDHTWLCDECGRDDEVPRLEYDGSGNSEGGVMLKDGKPVPFDEYSQSWGDPNNYTSLYAVVETKCEHCGEWAIKDSLGGIDFYTIGPDHWETGTFTPEQVAAMPEGYLRNTAEEMLEEARKDPEPAA